MAPGWQKRMLVPLAVAFFAWGHVTRRAFHWDCPVRTLLHYPCPTCGMTSAFRAMLRLDFHATMHEHPLAIVVVPFVIVLVVIELAGYVATAKFGTWTNKSAVRIAGFAMCTALFLFWLARAFGAFGGPARV